MKQVNLLHSVFGLGVFSMAPRHGLVSLRHAAPPSAMLPFFFFFFNIYIYFFIIIFFRINAIIILKRDDTPVNFYDIGWLLYQRIINTERRVLICLSPTQDQLTAANCMICSVDVWLPMEPTCILSPGKSVQKSLIALSQSVHTKAVQHFHKPCVNSFV